MLLLFWLFYYHFSYFYYFLTLFIYSSFYYVVIIYIIVSLISLPFLYGRAGPPDPGRGRLAFFIRTCWSAGSRTAVDLPFFYGLISFTHLFSYCHAIIYLVHLYIFFKQFL